MGKAAGCQLVSFWEGDITWIERLCIKSMLDVGEDLKIFSYHPRWLENTVSGVEVADARTIIAEDSMMCRRVRPFWPAFFSDVFRLELLSRGCGLWVDLDVLLLRPITPMRAARSAHVFGWERPDLINNAVLYIPSDSALLAEALAICYAGRKTAPWWTPAKRLRRYLQAATQQFRASLSGEEAPIFPKTFMGPHLITYLAHKHGLESLAHMQDVFYPVANRDFRILLAPDASVVEDYLKPETVSVHLWRGALAANGLLRDFPTTGFLGNACRTFALAA